MKDIDFLTIEDVLLIHEQQIACFGGQMGLRSRALLESALAVPMASFGDQYLHKNLFSMAAAYLFHLVQNHPFIDGNKRVGAVAANVFLKLNGFEINASPEAYEKLVLETASGECTKETIADFIRDNARPA